MVTVEPVKLPVAIITIAGELGGSVHIPSTVDCATPLTCTIRPVAGAPWIATIKLFARLELAMLRVELEPLAVVQVQN